MTENEKPAEIEDVETPESGWPPRARLPKEDEDFEE